MRRAVILGGAGAMGRLIARDMKQAGVVEPVIADRELGPARGLDIELAPVDLADGEAVARALAGADCVVAALPYRMNLTAMDAALAARAHYIDLGGLFHMTRRQRERAAEFRDAGRMAILGLGSAPGIVNVMAAHAADGMTRVDEVHCMVGARDDTRWETPPLLQFGYSPDTLLDEFSLPAAIFRDGALHMVPPLDPAERRRERFPAPVGELDLDVTLHSELATLPDFFRARGVREVTFRQSFDAGFADRLRALVEVPRERLAELLAGQAPPRPAGPIDRCEVLRVRVLGSKGGPAEAVVVDCVAGPDAGGGVGPDIDTGAPPSIAAGLLGDELPVSPGVFAPEEVIPWAPFRRELERRGLTISSAR